MKANILEALAQLAEFEVVPLGSTLEVIAGSVNVVAKFLVATREEASSAQGRLSEAVVSSALADGIYIESSLTVEIEEVRAQGQGNASASSSAVVVAAAAAGVVVVAAVIGGAYIFVKRRAGSNPSTAPPSVGETETVVDVEEPHAVANIKAMERVYSLRI